MMIPLYLAILAVPCVFAVGNIHPLSDEYIQQINSKQTTWKAGRNFPKNTTMSYIRRLLGALKNPTKTLERKVHIVDDDTNIPDTFDAREYWPKCPSIKEIQDQSDCGSCWAVAAASAMSDRICIASNSERQISVSAEDLLSCCYECGFGCNGGWSERAWLYWHSDGIVSGGKYNTSRGCRDYSMPPCEHHITGKYPVCPGGEYDTPSCTKQCDTGSNLDYKSDRSYGFAGYYVDSDVKQIQLEILKNGPVEASFIVYEDFVSYKSGVYQSTSTIYLGNHAVRLLGWGTENDTPYWLVANSWNEDWGDNGFFKILRGNDECNFEDDIVAGLPRL